MDSIPQRVFWKDRDSVFLGCNNALAMDAGLSDPAEIVGHSDGDCAWHASAEIFRADDVEVMESGRAKMDIDEPMRFPDGRTVWLRTSKVPLRDADGTVFGVLGTYEDVTERRQATLDLAESEERFRATFEQAAVGLAHVGADGRWLRVNRRLCEMFGYSREELLARTFQEVTHPDDLAADVALYGGMLAGETGDSRTEKRYVRRDGTSVWTALTVSLLRDETGSPKYFICVIEDIEPRRRAESERRRLAEIVAQSSDLVMMTDLAGDITYVNPAFERITGFARQEVEGRNPRLLRSGRQGPDVYAELWAKLSRGETWSGSLVNHRRDGSPVDVDATIFPVRDDAGHVVNYVAIQRDITQEVRLRGQLQQVQKMESVGRLAGGIAHDFNNLLTVILGFTDIVLADKSLQRREAILQIQHAGERAAALTRQLLAFSRKQVFKLELLDLNTVITGTESMLRRMIGEDVVLSTAPAPVRAVVKADCSQIEQALLNLAVNARDAMPQGGTLRISVCLFEADAAFAAANHPVTAGSYVVLSVADTGCGMDAETKRRVFEPFFTTKPRGAGTGLGLASVHGIVQQSGGFVTFESEVGLGTTFHIHLPRVAEPDAAPGGSPAPAPAPPRGAESILLVEDDAALRGLARMILASHGYRVQDVDSGARALDIVRSANPAIDLVVSDVVMPGMGGRELERRLAEMGCGARVLFMSGYPDGAVERSGTLETGAHFIEKPFTPGGLARKVREVLDAAR